MRALAALMLLLGEQGSLWDCLAGLEARLVTPAQAEYSEAAESWNKQCTGQRPVGVLYPHTAAAVAGAVQCARARGVRVVPRSGGGSFACYAERNGTLTLSLEEMAWVRVGGPRHAPTVTVGGGTRLGALYYHVNRLAGSSWSVVAGTCPSVGVGGHILGGGEGYLSSLHGLACDQLQSLTLVDARGRLVTADRRRNARLFAAHCGSGGGNFGIVVEMTLRLVRVAPSYTEANILIDKSVSAAFLEWYEASMLAAADPRLFLQLRLSKERDTLELFFPGGVAELEAEMRRVGLLGGPFFPFASLAAAGPPGPQAALRSLVSHSSYLAAAVSFAGGQGQGTPESLLNVTYMRGRRDSFKQHSFCSPRPTSAAGWQRFKDALDAEGVVFMAKRAGPTSAVARVAPGATAFPWRTAQWCSQVFAGWKKPEDREAKLASVERVRLVAQQIFTNHAYVNYIEGSVPVEAYYGSNMGWLRRLKAQIDPACYWCSNPQSIRPAFGPAYMRG